MNIQEALETKDFDFGNVIIDANLGVHNNTTWNQWMVTPASGEVVATKLGDWAEKNLAKLDHLETPIANLASLRDQLVQNASDSIQKQKILNIFSSRLSLVPSTNGAVSKGMLYLKNGAKAVAVVGALAVSLGLLTGAAGGSKEQIDLSTGEVPLFWKGFYGATALGLGLLTDKVIAPKIKALPLINRISISPGDKKNYTITRWLKNGASIGAALLTAHLGSQGIRLMQQGYLEPEYLDGYFAKGAFSIIGLHLVNSFTTAEQHLPYAASAMNLANGPMSAASIPVIDGLMRTFFDYDPKWAAATATLAVTAVAFPTYAAELVGHAVGLTAVIASVAGKVLTLGARVFRG